MRIALLACYFATWALIPHLLLLKKRPSATLAWLWAIIFIPFVGGLAYFAIGTDRLKRRRLRRRNLYSARAAHQGSETGSTDAATAALLEKLPRARPPVPAARSPGSTTCRSAPPGSLRILRDAKEFYAALEARIREAKHHIHLEFYIWNGDETGLRFLNAPGRGRPPRRRRPPAPGRRRLACLRRGASSGLQRGRRATSRGSRASTRSATASSSTCATTASSRSSTARSASSAG